MAPGYDGGQSEIPGGVAGAVERVLVVGAGIAGLTVANALAHAGVDCLVLEARRRVGGRLHTVDLAGVPVDLGGSWLHHPSGNPLRRFAREAGLDCRPGDPLPTLTAFDVATGLWQSHEDVEAGLTVELERFTEALPALRDRLGPGASAADGIEAFLASTDLAGEPLRRAGQGLRASVEADAAGAAEHQSLQWLWTQDEYDDAYFGDLPEGGYAAVVDAMAAGLDVRLDWPVAQVDLTDDGVTVTSASGQTETGSHVVVAIPLGVLKSGLPSFTPPLPAERLEAVRRLGFGRYEKVALRFDSPFWREAGWSHLVLFPPEPDRAGGLGLRPRRVRHRPDPRVPHLPLRRRPRPRTRTGRCRRLGDRPARRRPRRAVPRTDGVRGDGVERGPVHGRRLHPRHAGSLQRRPRPARHTRRRPAPVRGRAHAERAGRLRRRRHDQRHPRGQAAPRHLFSDAGSIPA